MTAALAHMLLAGRHHQAVIVRGLHWRYCTHRSHRIRLPCWRWQIYDSQCAHHNRTCYTACTR